MVCVRERETNHSSVVMTVFNWGNFCLAYLLPPTPAAVAEAAAAEDEEDETSQGEISSMLPSPSPSLPLLWPPFFPLAAAAAAADIIMRPPALEAGGGTFLAELILLLKEFRDEASWLCNPPATTGLAPTAAAAAAAEDEDERTFLAVTELRERVTGWLDAKDVSWKKKGWRMNCNEETRRVPLYCASYWSRFQLVISFPQFSFFFSSVRAFAAVQIPPPQKRDGSATPTKKVHRDAPSNEGKGLEEKKNRFFSLSSKMGISGKRHKIACLMFSHRQKTIKRRTHMHTSFSQTVL